MRPELGYEALKYLTDEVVFIHGEDRQILFVSPSVEHVLGYSPEEFRLLRTLDLIHPDDASAAFETAVQLRARAGASYRSELRVRRADGSFLWCEVVGRNLLSEEVGGVVNTLRDISERRALEEQLTRQALEDELTGLLNRRAFMAALERAVKESGGVGLGVLILDFDGFKAVNDRLGHPAGDELLRACAHDIAGALRVGDSVARLGGDEFAMLCHRVESPQALVAAGDRIRRAAGGRRELAAGPCDITVSVGATLGALGATPIELVRAADEALYEAKAAGRDRTRLDGL